MLDDADATTTALSVDHVSMRFGGVRALDDVLVQIARSEVHGILGENGSGKSTLIKCISGLHTPEAGATLALYGEDISFPVDAASLRAHGVGFVHQDLGLIPGMTVLENMVLGRIAVSERHRISWRAERRRVQAEFRSFGLDIDLNTRCESLDKESQCELAVARAITAMGVGQSSADAGVLFLDEPTVYLSAAARAALFRVVRTFVDRGGSAVLVTHDIDEAIQECDRITVLRDGRRAGTVQRDEVDTDQLIELIVGRHIDRSGARTEPVVPSEDVAAAATVGVTVEGVTSADNEVIDVSLNVAPGEVLGLTGLIGSGFERIPYLLYGSSACSAGTMTVGKTTTRLAKGSPARSVGRGIFLVPVDRKVNSLTASLPLWDNVLSSPRIMRRYFRGGPVRFSRMIADTRNLLAGYRVKPDNPHALGSQLSGGNQQKVVLAKWINSGPKLLLLHEPTQGVDIGARQEITRIVREMAAGGTPVICASVDHEQLADVCDRVVIFSSGKPVETLRDDQIEKSFITNRCLAVSRTTKVA